MAEKKPLSVEEILAACRGADGPGGSPAAETTAAPAAESAPADSPAAPVGAPGPKKKPGAMSVAEMMAAARAEKGKAAAAPATAAKSAPAKAVASKEPAKPAAVAAKPTSQPMDTASILAAARKTTQAGPISKAEAAKLKKDAPKTTVPPRMPEKPAYAMAKPVVSAEQTDRRNFFSVIFGSFLAVGFFCLAAVSGIWGLGLARFLFPNILTEPPSKFKVGFPADFPPDTVATKFKSEFGVWVVNTEFDGQRQITALKSVCTHLGCTPNWLEGEQKFKCPCHGSGFYIDGVNFEGPAPRPLERYAIRIADDGQIEIDKSKKFQQEMGQWNSPACYVPV